MPVRLTSVEAFSSNGQEFLNHTSYINVVAIINKQVHASLRSGRGAASVTHSLAECVAARSSRSGDRRLIYRSRGQLLQPY